MIITCKKGAPQAEIDKIIKEFEDKGLEDVYKRQLCQCGPNQR